MCIDVLKETHEVEVRPNAKFNPRRNAPLISPDSRWKNARGLSRQTRIMAGLYADARLSRKARFGPRFALLFPHNLDG